MKLWTEGDRSRAVCERCKKVVTTRFERRTVHLTEPAPVDVPGVLVGACSACGEVASIPPQSSPRLRVAQAEAARQVEIRIPASLEDAMGLVAEKYSTSRDPFEAAAVRYFLHEISRDHRVAARIKGLLDTATMKGSGDRRLTIRVRGSELGAALAVAKEVGVEGMSDLIRGILALMAADAGIITGADVRPDRRHHKAMGTIARVVR